MKPRTPRGVLLACSCRSSAPTTRHASTSTASTSSPPSQTPRIVASALVSRAPLVLPAPSELEKTYHAYQRQLHRAFNKPLDVSLSWYFKKGSAAEGSFVAFEKKVGQEDGRTEVEEMVQLATEGLGREEVVGQMEESKGKDADRKSLERRADRTVYLLLKKNRKDNAWQFPQGGVEEGESLLEAAKRELKEETGPDMDVWAVGRVPAGTYSYAFPKEHIKKNPSHNEAKVFFLPMRVLRGQAKPNKEEGLVDYAWLTKEEVKDSVTKSYWAAVEPILSDR